MPALNRFRTFEALDSCHKEIQQNLDALEALAEQFSQGTPDALARSTAAVIETFFSTTARGHHATEEEEVFPSLLISENAALVARARDLIEDHFWIEKYWQDLAPMLKDISRGADSDVPARFLKAAKLFWDLSSYHIESEESMIYPQAKASLNAMQVKMALE
jgi:hemerythrin-like domain-containing protein